MYKKLVEEYAENPRDVATVPIRKRERRWFYVFAEKGFLYVCAARRHEGSCNIKEPIRLKEKQLAIMLDIYHRRQNGEAVSSEASRVSLQASYWYGVFADMDW